MVKRHTSLLHREVREFVAAGLQTHHGDGMVRPTGVGLSSVTRESL